MKQKECFPILLQDKRPIETFTFDGCYYYFLLSQCKEIIKTNLEFEEIKCFHLKRQYSCICYAWSNCCFFAYDQKTPYCLYQLNCNFEEISIINLCENCIGNNQVTSISFNCCLKHLIISTVSKIIEIQLETGECLRSYAPQVGSITGSYAFPPFYLFLAYHGNIQSLYALNYSGTLWKLCSFKADQEVRGLVFYPGTKHCSESYFEFLVVKCECTPEICRLPLSQLPSIQESCPCNYKLHCCKQPPIPPIPPTPPCCNILESIALEEAAISHILNAEGEKLQKVLAISNDINTILCVNKEVNETIVNVTGLEQVLYSKLLTASKYCFDDSNPCKYIPPK